MKGKLVADRLRNSRARLGATDWVRSPQARVWLSSVRTARDPSLVRPSLPPLEVWSACVRMCVAQTLGQLRSGVGQSWRRLGGCRSWGRLGGCRTSMTSSGSSAAPPYTYEAPAPAVKGGRADRRELCSLRAGGAPAAGRTTPRRESCRPEELQPRRTADRRTADFPPRPPLSPGPACLPHRAAAHFPAHRPR